MLNVSDRWLRAMSQPTVELTASVTLDVAGGTTGFVMAPHPIGDYMDMVAHITPVSGKLDPLTRRTGAGELSITFVDEGAGSQIRQLIQGSRVFGKRVVVKIGTRDIGLSDYAPYFDGVVADITPVEGHVIFRCVDFFGILKTRTVKAKATNQHPLQILYYHNPNPGEGTGGLLVRAGIPVDRIDTASFNPDLLASGAYVMSHWNTGRGIHGPNDREEAEVDGFQVMQEVNILLGGCMFITEEGKIKFTPYDPNGPIADAWTADDVDDLKQKNAYGDIYNQFRIDFGWKGQGQGASDDERRQMGTNADVGDAAAQWLYQHLLDDEESQANWAVPGATERVLQLLVQTKWAGVESFLVSPEIQTGINPITLVPEYGPDPIALRSYEGTGGSYTVEGGWCASFCGVPRIRDDYQDGALESSLTNGRTAYHMIISENGQDAEIIEVDNVLTPGNAHWVGGDGSGAPARVTFRIKKRAVNFGEPEREDFPPGCRVVDVTIPVLMAQRYRDRWVDGCPEISCTTNLSKHFVQLGDQITLQNDLVLTFQMDGAPASVRWEIISKEEDPSSDVPKIRWGLKMVRPAKAPTTQDWNTEPFNPTEDYRGLDDIIDDHITDLTVVADFDLGNLRIAPGVATVKGIRRSIADSIDVTFPPGGEDWPQPGDPDYEDGVDGHLVYDGFSHQIMLVGTNLGAAVSLGAYQQALGTATMGATASAATASYTDKRATSPRLIDPEIKDSEGNLENDRKLVAVAGEIKTVNKQGVETPSIKGASLKAGTGVVANLDDNGRQTSQVWAEQVAGGNRKVVLKNSKLVSFVEGDDVTEVPTAFGNLQGQTVVASKQYSDGQRYAIVVDRESTNLFEDPTFERGNEGWYISAIGYTSPTMEVLEGAGNFIFGSRSLRITFTGSSAFARKKFGGQPVAGANYVGALWVRKNSATTDQFTLTFGIMDGSGSVVDTAGTVIRANSFPMNTWVRVDSSAFTLIAPADPSGHRFYFELGRDTGANCSIDIACPQLEEGLEPSAFFYGDLDGCEWEGEPYLSSSYRAGGFHSVGPTANDSDGMVLWDDGILDIGGVPVNPQVGLRIYQTVNQPTPATDTLTKVLYTSAYSPGVTFDLSGGMDVVNSRFYCPVKGLYHVNMFIGWAVPQSTQYQAQYLYKNGVSQGVAHQYVSDATAGTARYHRVSCLVACEAGDYLEHWVVCNGSVGNRVVTAGTFEVFLATVKPRG